MSDTESSDPVRVFHLITRFRDGGAETTTVNEIEALQSADRNYHVYLGTGNDYLPEELDRVSDLVVDVEVIRFMRHFNPLTALLAVFEVAICLRKLDIDILHTHSTEAGVIGRLSGCLAGTETVVHEIHGDPITADRSKLLNTFILFAERVSMRCADAIIAKSDLIRHTYLERGIGSEEQYTIIPHSIDVSRFSDRSPAEITEDAPNLILFVGRVVDGKGIFDLIAAVAALDTDARLLIAGEGPAADDVEAEIRRHSLDDIHLLGYRNDIPELLAGTDVLVLPSYREGTPRVITEAMAAGVPSIATDIAGIPDQITHGENGLLIEPGDVDALTEHIEYLLTNPTVLQAMSEEAADRATEFHKETIRQDITSFYESVVGKPGKRSP